MLARVTILALLVLGGVVAAGCTSNKVREYCHEFRQDRLDYAKLFSAGDAAASLARAGWTASAQGSLLNATKSGGDRIALTADIAALVNGTELRLKMDAAGYTKTPAPADWPSVFASTEQQLAKDLGAPFNRTLVDAGHNCVGTLA